MRGIVSYGSYLPYHLMRRDTIGAALGAASGKGTRTVASYDEDTTTLAVEAARRASGAAEGIASVVLATSNPAYLDKTNAAALHAALDLPDAAYATDVTGLRSGATSLLTALRGSIPTLVCASDIRSGRPGSDEEAGGGDGAAAFVIAEGSEQQPVIAAILGTASTTREFMDRWRIPGEATSQTWEERFGETVYAGMVEETFVSALKEAGIAAEDVDHVAVVGAHTRAVRAAAKEVGGSRVADLSATVGRAGTADAGLHLAAMLDEAGPGERLVVVSLADGVDVLVLETTEALATIVRPPTVAAQLATGVDDIDYPTFLFWRGTVERQPPRRPNPARPAAPPAYRSREWKYRFTGSQDRTTGAVHLPPARVSFDGGAVDEMTPVGRADSRGSIATFTIDHLAYTPNPPVIVAVVDFDGGGRFIGEVTDARPDEIAVGTPVEMTFRRLYTEGGVHNYFWKARPVRGEES